MHKELIRIALPVLRISVFSMKMTAVSANGNNLIDSDFG
jgi:hypothetical protein